MHYRRLDMRIYEFQVAENQMTNHDGKICSGRAYSFAGRRRIEIALGESLFISYVISWSAPKRNLILFTLKVFN